MRELVIGIVELSIIYFIFYIPLLLIYMAISEKFNLKDIYWYENKHDNVYITFQDEFYFGIRHLSIGIILLILLLKYKPQQFAWFFDLMIAIPTALELFTGLSAIEFVVNYIRSIYNKIKRK